ncbi:purine and uridine phosphorylase [Ascobolus immersus RN42]|uniref:Purine and uridine phosphorylase n=1 Tax=Ascobolus immersus RN42 TaxID=1160509 RepID=A0A3N4ICQ0_ASCIM|nr:purine and uridine phosphorylase [Ascobolus immersus RN42]
MEGEWLSDGCRLQLTGPRIGDADATLRSATAFRASQQEEIQPENQYGPEEYTVGWICALPSERAAARGMLDEIHADDHIQEVNNSGGAYTLGRIGKHNVVITGLPKGMPGKAQAAAIAINMMRTFPSIRFGLMVGIGGGAPINSEEKDIRLGDVVVSAVSHGSPGVVQYDFGKSENGVFKQVGTLNKPPPVLASAVQKLESHHEMEDSKVEEYMTKMLAKHPKMLKKYGRPMANDCLFEAGYLHQAGAGPGRSCKNCDMSYLVSRDDRDDSSPQVHYGLIGSADNVMRDALKRDLFAMEKGILCYEMEAAGLMDNIPCLVIRGIADYSDSHKNDAWQAYASAAAAAYAKELLLAVPASQVKSTPTLDVDEICRKIGNIDGLSK